MAEQVQAVLDGMVAPLRNLMERGIFSQEEIKAIVTRRRDSEYLVRRRVARKADFLRYIEKELQLEQLRELRMKTHKITKHEVGDKHIVQHVHFLFARILRKFRNDVSLYLEYIDFCKSIRSFKTLSKVYAQALQVNPRNAGLWIAAASHEFFEEGSVANARILLQRGLRVNSSSPELWLQYFLLELHYIQKLKGRREILQQEQAKENDNSQSLDNKSIPTLVYDNAITAIPAVPEFRLQFMDLLEKFPSTTTLKSHIMETLARDFESDPNAWIARAAYTVRQKTNDETIGFEVETQDYEQVSKRRKKDGTTNNDEEESNSYPVLAVMEEAMEAVPTAEMYVQSIQFLRSLDENEEEYQLFIHKLLIQAKDKEIFTTKLTLEEADVLVQEGKLNAAIQTLQEAATSPNKEVEQAVDIWLTWARLCAAATEECCDTSASRVLKMALERTPLYSKEQTMLLLELFGALLMEASDDNSDTTEKVGSYKTQLAQLFERMLLLSAGTDTAPFDDDEAVFGISSVAAACLQYLRFSLSTGGMEAARKVYEQVLYRSNYGTSSGTNKTIAELQILAELLDECIQMETNDDNSTNKKKRKHRLGRLYDAAIQLFDETNPSLADSYRSRRDSNVRYG